MTPQIESRRTRQGTLLILPTKNGEKTIGRIVGSNLHVWRGEQRHYFRTFSGYGIAKNLLTDTRLFPYSRIQITIASNDGTKRVYQVPRERWLEAGRTWTDYRTGFQPQIICPTAVIIGQAPVPERPEDLQPSLSFVTNGETL